MCKFQIFRMQQISIHAPARGATPCPPLQCSHLHFNPRSRTGSDSHPRSHGYEFNYFNPRSRTGSDVFVLLPARSLYDFNPRSRTGSDARWQSLFIPLPISIHAPARGATPHGSAQRGSIRNFNPRSRTGSDFRRIASQNIQRISIHAPARGATGSVIQRDHIIDISIHAPARGATLWSWILPNSSAFQSTLPHGERLPRRRIGIRLQRFQSTLPHGERHTHWPG